MCQHKEFYPKESFILNVSEKYKDLFKFNVTQLTIDFIVEEENGDLVAYDLVCTSLRGSGGVAKSEMFKEQFPELNCI